MIAITCNTCKIEVVTVAGINRINRIEIMKADGTVERYFPSQKQWNAINSIEEKGSKKELSNLYANIAEDADCEDVITVKI